MPRVIDRDEVQRLMDHGAQLIDVLPKKEYAESHLPGAINIPLQSLNEKTVAQLRKDCSVIVYCYDYQSPRAAWRLDSLGFPEVFDYMPGKMDWLAYGLPVEKKVGAAPMLIERIERQVPTCRLKDSLGEAKQQADRLGSRICAVVNDRYIVLGLLQEDAWKNDLSVAAEKVMESGPTTLRPSFPVDDAAELLAKRGQDAILVTCSDGKLIGVFKRPESAANKPKSEIGHD